MMRFSGLLTLLLAACGDDLSSLSQDSAVSTQQAIINGMACDENTDPTAVSIIMDLSYTSQLLGDGRLRSPSCTGTLIAPDVVLAAAHCVDRELLAQQFGGLAEIEALAFYISFQADVRAVSGEGLGGAPGDLPSDAVDVVGTVAHPDFFLDENSLGGLGQANDVSLIFLATPVTRVAPMAIMRPADAAAITEGATVRIAGWGQQEPSSGDPFDPANADIVAGVKQCGEAFINEVGEYEIQVGAGLETTRKCHGDSGGPTYLTLAGGQTRVIGVTSRAYSTADCDEGGVDMRVDAYADWIDAEMAVACTSELRIGCDVVPAEGEGEGEEGEGEGREGEGEGPPGCNHNNTSRGIPAQRVLLLMSALVAANGRRAIRRA
jgi:Trypsin